MAGMCSHPGGFRTKDGGWECSDCGHVFASYEAWGESSAEAAASVAAVKAAIEADITSDADLRAALADAAYRGRLDGGWVTS